MSEYSMCSEEVREPDRETESEIHAHGEALARSGLEGQIAQVRGLRVALEIRTQQLHELQIAFNQQHASLIEDKCKISSDLIAAESRLRELTLEAYAATGDKKPATGVGIRVVKSLVYEEDKALHWCVSNQYLNCLQLNKANFKKVAEGLGPDFCEIREEAQATIAREL